MCDFMLNKIFPVLLGLLGVASVDTPGNIVRQVLLNMISVMSSYFQLLTDRL